MRKAFHQLGYIISNNAMKFNINYIQWPYSAPVVLDEDWHITPIVTPVTPARTAHTSFPRQKSCSVPDITTVTPAHTARTSFLHQKSHSVPAHKNMTVTLPIQT